MIIDDPDIRIGFIDRVELDLLDAGPGCEGEVDERTVFFGIVLLLLGADGGKEAPDTELLCCLRRLCLSGSHYIPEIQVLEPGLGEFLVPDLVELIRKAADRLPVIGADAAVELEFFDLEGCALWEDQAGEVGDLVYGDDLLIGISSRLFWRLPGRICGNRGLWLLLPQGSPRILIDNLDNRFSGRRKIGRCRGGRLLFFQQVIKGYDRGCLVILRFCRGDCGWR